MSKFVDNIYLPTTYKNKKKKETNKFKKNTILYVIILIIFIFFIACYFFIKKENLQKIILLASYFKNGKHLIIFQNNAELRPTGGFIGSYMTFETKYFIPKNLKIETNIYKKDNEYTYKKQIPYGDDEVLNALSENKAQLRDSNWWVDFSLSAEKIIFYFKEQNDYEPDTVTAINSELFVNLLKIIGSINMPKYNIVLDADNFNEATQNHIENEYYQNQDNQVIHEPKSILSEIFPIVFARIKETKYWPNLYDLIFTSFKEKNILLYSKNTNIQEKIIKQNIGGTLLNNNTNYLYINHANVGSNKSSRYIYEDIYYNLNSNILTLSIDRDYEDFGKASYENDPMNNINFTRIYLPKGSIVINAKKDDVDIFNELENQEEYGLSVIRVWTKVEKNNKHNFSFTIQLPEIYLHNSEKLIIQKQSGVINQRIKIDINNKNIFDGIFDKDLFF